MKRPKRPEPTEIEVKDYGWEYVRVFLYYLSLLGIFILGYVIGVNL
jgi:hypothetical protein